MGAHRGHCPPDPRLVRFLRIGATVLLAPLIAWTAPWQDGLTADVLGPTPEVRPFQAEFRFGWSEIEAAHVSTNIRYEGGDVFMDATGSTTGMARLLWQMDFSHRAHAARQGFQTIETTQTETYKNRVINIHMIAKPDGLWRLRETGGPTPGTWKKVNISPLRDLFAGMLFLRSQKLDPGDEIQTIIYPGDSPFLVKLNAISTENITVAGVTRPALKLDLRLQRINLKKGSTLEENGKFRSGTVWLSNDADRVPLRAEVEIFIGYVFAELTSITFP